MKRLGFFIELPHGDPDGGSLIASVDHLPNSLVEAAAAYLESGSLLAAVPAVGCDVLSDDRNEVPSPHLMTDGTWLWPADLPYYVRKYAVALPEGFLRHAAGSGWKVEVTPAMLERIVDEMAAE